MPIPNAEERFTFQDYCTWPDEERWELIGGQPYNMSPAPTCEHQEIVGNFFHLLKNALKGKPCKPYISPTDVVLSEHDVVQPDVFAVCDPDKIKKENIQGAPDLVIEVLSPSTAKKDRWDKKKLYERFGVREYILADLEGRFVERYTLQDNGAFDRGEVFGPDDILPLVSLESIDIALDEVFDF